MKKKIYLAFGLSLGLGISEMANAQQKIGANPGNLNPGAILELEAASGAPKGFLLPRISISALNTYGLVGNTPTEGMMVYNTNTTTGIGYYVWSGGAWSRIFTGSIAATTNALTYNTGTRILTSTVNGVAASTSALPLATGTATGLLSSADWADFNAKENALTFSNGLTRSTNAISLGGALTSATSLTLGANNFTFGGATTGKVIISGPSGSSTSGLQLSNLLTAVTPTAASAGQRVLTVDGSGNIILGTDFGTSNAGTVTNVTGTAPINVASGTTTPVISINALGITSGLLADGAVTTSKLAPAGTAGQVLTSTGGSTAPTWQSLPAATNIYSADGSIAAARTVTLGTNNLTFSASGTGQFIVSGPTGNTAGLRLSNLTGAGTAGTAGQKVLSVNANGDVVLVTDFGTANAGTVTNVTGTAPITVTNGTTTPVIGINQSAMDLNSIGGTLPISKITPSGTSGQVLTSNGTGAAPTWTSLPVSTNIYTADGTLTGNRTVTMNSNLLTFQGSEAGAGDVANQSLLRLFRPGTLGLRFSPTADFQVGGYNSGNTSASTRLNIRLSDGTVNSPDVNVMTLLGNGRVGIGTTNPQRDLHIVGDGGMRVDRIASAGRTAFYLNQLGASNNLLGGFGMLADTSVISMGYAPNSGGLDENVLNVTKAGNVGIGTITPSQKLTVNGGALISSLAGSGSRMVVANASGVLSTQAIPASTNIYNTNGTLTGNRTVDLNLNQLRFNMGGTANDITLGAGHAGTNPRVAAADTLEFQTGGNAYQLTLFGNGNVGIGSQGNSAGFRPTSSSRIELNGSVGFPIRRITSASTLGIGDYTVIANAFAAGFAITLPAPNTCEGRVYVIRKVDESSNAITFTFTGITGSNAIRVSDTSATQGEYINSLNFTKTLRIQSNGTDWYLID